MNEAEALCDRIAILVNGGLCCVIPTEKLKKLIGGYNLKIMLNPSEKGYSGSSLSSPKKGNMIRQSDSKESGSGNKPSKHELSFNFNSPQRKISGILGLSPPHQAPLQYEGLEELSQSQNFGKINLEEIQKLDLFMSARSNISHDQIPNEPSIFVRGAKLEAKKQNKENAPARPVHEQLIEMLEDVASLGL